MKIEEGIFPNGWKFKKMFSDNSRIYEAFGYYTIFKDGFVPKGDLKSRRTEKEAQIYILKKYIKEKTKFLNEAKKELNKLICLKNH